MRLIDEFTKKGYYHSILNKERSLSDDKLFIEYLYDQEEEPREELIDIFLSKHGDELFIVLKGDAKNPGELCKWWDKRISRFTAFGSTDYSILKKFKYNVIQLVLYSGVSKTIIDGKTKIIIPKEINREEEGSVQVSRKIFLPYTEEDGQIVIPDEEAVEIPFYLIPLEDFHTKSTDIEELEACVPDEEEMAFLYSAIAIPRKKAGGAMPLGFNDEQFEKTKEWLLNENKENYD